MAKKSKKQKRSSSKRRDAEDLDRTEKQAREARTAVKISTVIYIGIWVIILFIVWSNGWYGPAR